MLHDSAGVVGLGVERRLAGLNRGLEKEEPSSARRGMPDPQGKMNLG